MFKKVLYYFFLFLGAFLVFFNFLKEIGYIIIGWYVISWIKSILENYDKYLLLFKCRTYYYNEEIRVSISYLFRIKIQDKYLLVRGGRIKNQFQPVGGVYKRLPEAVSFFNKLGIKDDSCMPIDKTSENDLRVRIKGNKVPEFLNWFDLGSQREHSVFREFYEELIKTQILSRDIFPYITYRYLLRKQTDIRYVDYFKCYEILIAEIFELIPDNEQKEELTGLINSSDDRFIWADEDTIKTKGVSKECLDSYISETSKWIL